MPRTSVSEDERKVRASLERGLLGVGNEVSTAASGDDGFQQALSDTFDCLILDLMLPGRDGLQVPTDLRRAGEWHKLTIEMIGDQIECSLDGKKDPEARDSVFQKAGKVGLWTKVDAQTSFAQFIITELKIRGSKT